MSDQDTSYIDKAGLQKYLEFFPAGCSFKSLDHFRQLIVSGKFAQYHYDTEKENKDKYGLFYEMEKEPPQYDLSKIQGIKISLICGKGDLLAQPADYKRVYEELQENNQVQMHEFPHGHIGMLIPVAPKEPTVTMLGQITADYWCGFDSGVLAFLIAMQE